MRCLYRWLTSGSSGASTNVCVKTWLELALAKDPKAIEVVRLAEDVCLNQISSEEDAIAIIEAQITAKYNSYAN